MPLRPVESNSVDATVRATRPCPLNDGIAVVDQILAVLTPRDGRAAYDAALDLRSLLRQHTNADAVLSDFIYLRAIIEDRHYLACYRLRRWLETQIVAHVTLDRGQPARIVSVRLDVPSMATLRVRSLDAAAVGGEVMQARVQFAFSAAG